MLKQLTNGLKKSSSITQRKSTEKKHVMIEIYFTYIGKIPFPFQKPELSASTEKAT